MNILQKVLADVENVVKEPIAIATKVKTIFEQVTEDTPQLRTVFIGLVSKLEAVGGDITAVVNADGVNISGDVQTFQDAAAAISYFRATVLPVVEQVYGQIKTDFAAPAAAAAPAPAASAAVAQTGPGLHNIIPA